MRQQLDILSSGAITAVGLSSPQTCAAIRAGISRFSESDFFHHSLDPLELEPITAAPMPLNSTFDDDHFLRLAGIAAHALKECIEGAGTNPSQTVLLLGLREPFRENPYLDGREVDLLRVIQQELGVRFHPDSSILPYGRTAAFQGLQIAHRLLTTNMIEACIIGGVDSYLNEFDLTRFEKSYRILSPSVSRGFIPGEGAAFVAISNQIVHTAKAPFVKIWGVGLANEDAEVTVLSDGHPTGKGLQRALETTLQDANIPESSIAFRVSDLNGESYYGIDSMLAMSRFYKTRREHLEIWHPADCVGDIGAASGALLIILASTGIVKGYAPGSIAMCEASSDGGLRAGCILGLYKV